MKAALVTGGSSGIGLAIASMLRDEGFDLTLASRTGGKVRRAAADLGANPIAANLTHEEECQRVVQKHGERFGRLDVLVNSAGVGIGRPIEQLSAKEWDLQLDVNLRAAFLVTWAAVPLLRESRGLVVNVASIAGTMPAPNLAAYGASKAALISFTRSLNAELGGDGIRATALSPGFVDTPMTSWAPVPAEEMIRPEDCAEVVRMLLRLGPRARVPHVVIERLG